MVRVANPFEGCYLSPMAQMLTNATPLQPGMSPPWHFGVVWCSSWTKLHKATIFFCVRVCDSDSNNSLFLLIPLLSLPSTSSLQVKSASSFSLSLSLWYIAYTGKQIQILPPHTLPSCQGLQGSEYSSPTRNKITLSKSIPRPIADLSITATSTSLRR